MLFWNLRLITFAVVYVQERRKVIEGSLLERREACIEHCTCLDN